MIKIHFLYSFETKAKKCFCFVYNYLLLNEMPDSPQVVASVTICNFIQLNTNWETDSMSNHLGDQNLFYLVFHSLSKLSRITLAQYNKRLIWNFSVLMTSSNSMNRKCFRKLFITKNYNILKFLSYYIAHI